MSQVSEIIHIFVSWFRKIPLHRGERLSFDPPENLENFMCTGDKSESCFSCSSIYAAYSVIESVHVYTCRCELISFYVHRYSRTFRLRMQEGSHSLYVCN